MLYLIIYPTFTKKKREYVLHFLFNVLEFFFLMY